jgi:hypothetical protein
MTRNSVESSPLQLAVDDAAVPTQHAGTSTFYTTRFSSPRRYFSVVSRYIYGLRHEAEVYSSVHMSIQ